jgi:SAM-dependent methyltransferase
MNLQRHKQEWEEMAGLDPLWAIVSHPEQRNGRWALSEFFATGEAEVATRLETANRFGLPRQRKRALDFGCGVGRATRAIATRFEECYGVDISEQMIRRAKELNADLTNCVFVVNATSDLQHFQSQTFDFVYCDQVLQHLPNHKMARRYIVEFLRVLRPGGLLLFQMPYLIPWRNRLQLRRRLYALLRKLGFGERFLYRLAGLNPIRMIAIPEDEVRRVIERHKGHVLYIERTAAALPAQPIRSHYYYVTT